MQLLPDASSRAFPLLCKRLIEATHIDLKPVVPRELFNHLKGEPVRVRQLKRGVSWDHGMTVRSNLLDQLRQPPLTVTEGSPEGLLLTRDDALRRLRRLRDLRVDLAHRFDDSVNDTRQRSRRQIESLT